MATYIKPEAIKDASLPIGKVAAMSENERLAFLVSLGLGNLTEVPNDGKVYGRTHGEWVETLDGRPWELIEEITLEEEISQIIRTEEPDGTPYDFQALMVHIYNGGGANFGISVRTVVYNKTEEILPVLAHCNNAGVARVRFYKRNGYWEGVGYYLNSNGVSYLTAGTERLNSVTEKKNITKLAQTISGNNPFKVGTVIKIFAIR